MDGKNDTNIYEEISNNTPIFKERLKKLMKYKGCSRYDIADILHLDKGTVDRYFRKKSGLPSLDKVCLLAVYFGISPSYLLGENDYTSKEKECIGDTLNLSPSAVDGLCNIFSVGNPSIPNIDYLLSTHSDECKEILFHIARIIETYSDMRDKNNHSDPDTITIAPENSSKVNGDYYELNFDLRRLIESIDFDKLKARREK